MESEQTVLITGASTGIGLAIARALTRTKYRTFLTARQESLARFDVHAIGESENVRIRPLDVTRAEEREAIIAEADRDWGGIDILINNAGVSYRAVVEHVEEHERLARFPEISAEREIQEASKQVELARTGLQRATAHVAQQEASVKQLENRLDRLAAVAPFDGTVAVRYLEPGTMAGPDAPVLRLVGDEGHWVRFAVPLDALDRLSVDRAVDVHVPSLGVALSGEIRQIAAVVDSASGMVFCEAMLEPGSETGGSALHNRTARVTLVGD